MRETVAAWEGQARSVVRLILSLLFFLHGLRAVYGLLPIVGRRRGVPLLAMDALPPIVGYFELVGGALLILGLFTRPVALLAALQAAVAYAVYTHGFWTLRNGGEEAMIYFLVFLYLASAGGGTWSLDALLQKRKDQASSATS
jgi:putative oxidoreductase